MVIPKNLSCRVKYRYILYLVKFLHLKFSTSLPNDNINILKTILQALFVQFLIVTFP